MRTRVISIDPSAPDEVIQVSVREAGAVLRRGGLVAFPTETVYGLGGDAFNEQAAARIYEAKGRPSDNPLIVHIADTRDLDRLLKDPADEASQVAARLAEAFWPGPLTMVLNKADDLPLQTTGGLKTVAVRLPSNRIARALIRAAGGYIAAPSANLSGRPSPTSASHCVDDLNGRVDLIIDGGDCEIGLESTIVDLTTPVPEILRPGKITGEELFRALGKDARHAFGEGFPSGSGDTGALTGPEEKAPRAPGMKYRHYAPKGQLVIVRGDTQTVRESIRAFLETARQEGKRTGVIAPDESSGIYAADVVLHTGRGADEDTLAHNLYRILRSMDETNVEQIFFEMPTDGYYTDAVKNRLYKACGGRVIKV